MPARGGSRLEAVRIQTCGGGTPEMSETVKKTSATVHALGRREFLGTTAGAAGAVLINPSLDRGTEANSALRVALLGCAGRGTEVATDLADTRGACVLALGDLFQDQLDTGRDHL